MGKVWLICTTFIQVVSSEFWPGRVWNSGAGSRGGWSRPLRRIMTTEMQWVLFGYLGLA